MPRPSLATPDQLLSAVARAGVADGATLAAQLGVSRKVLNTLVQRAGDRLCRAGHTSRMRYARTREIEGVGVSAPVFVIDEQGRAGPARTLWMLANGGHWLVDADARAYVDFAGLPPFAADMAPQGFLGRGFARRYPELQLPGRAEDWSNDQVLLALARRGEDCVGDVILGTESLDRWLAQVHEPVPADEYPELARRAVAGQGGSSAGGEHPKFAAFTGDFHVLVKFAGDEDSLAARRWRDLLLCEHLALEAISRAGIPASRSTIRDRRGMRFLEVERFDRAGLRGRRGVLSLNAIDNEHYGTARDDWTGAAERLLADGRISADDARRIRWLDVFGQLTGNDDRHYGNLSFFTSEDGTLRLAPAYDMLPMLLRPVETQIVERAFDPRAPTRVTLDVWGDASQHARVYWETLATHEELSQSVRAFATRSLEALERRISAIAPSLPSR